MKQCNRMLIINGVTIETVPHDDEERGRKYHPKIFAIDEIYFILNYWGRHVYINPHDIVEYYYEPIKAKGEAPDISDQLAATIGISERRLFGSNVGEDDVPEPQPEPINPLTIIAAFPSY